MHINPQLFIYKPLALMIQHKIQWMKTTIFYLALLVLCPSCKNVAATDEKKAVTDSISIFEIYLEDSVAVDRFSALFRDTLKLPVEWEPFDFFGNGVVYDAAFHLGNTTLELLSVQPPDSNINVPARYNRILFRSENIDSTSLAIMDSGITQLSSFDFNIVSDHSELMIGRQINIDSISSLSNINIAFWEYLNSGYSFAERTIKGKSIDDLRSKLDSALVKNPMGIMNLKEVHLSISRKAIDEWNKLLGPAVANRWILADGPIISFTPSLNNVGSEWITIRVQNLEVAREFLSQNGLLAMEYDKILIEPSKVYGLKIYVEE